MDLEKKFPGKNDGGTIPGPSDMQRSALTTTLPQALIYIYIFLFILQYIIIYIIMYWKIRRNAVKYLTPGFVKLSGSAACSV